MKIAIDKITNRISGFAMVNGVDLSYIPNCNIKIVTSEMPDRVEVCKWDGKKIIVDATLKATVIAEEEKQIIIDSKRNEILAERRLAEEAEAEAAEVEIDSLAIQRAIDDGLLNIDGTLTSTI